MTAVWTLPITAGDLQVVLADLWDTVFAVEPRPLAAEPPSAQRLWSAVDLVDGEGPVVSVLLASCPDTFRGVGRYLFQVPDLTPRHMEDMVGEACNIVAGNVKGILRLRTALASPWAGWGEDPPVEPGIPVLGTVADDERGHWMSIRVADHRGPTPHGGPYD